MKKDYEKIWNNLVVFIENNECDKAKEIWDDLVEIAWKYDDLN